MRSRTGRAELSLRGTVPALKALVTIRTLLTGILGLLGCTGGGEPRSP